VGFQNATSRIYCRAAAWPAPGSALLESDAVKGSMAGLRQDWSAYAGRIPAVGIVADQERNNRLDFSPIARRRPQ
jgi:hypothetical protein